MYCDCHCVLQFTADSTAILNSVTHVGVISREREEFMRLHSRSLWETYLVCKGTQQRGPETKVAEADKPIFHSSYCVPKGQLCEEKQVVA